LPSASFVGDPSNPGKFIVQFGEDIPGTSDALTLRLAGGQLQYALNGAGFTNDLDSSTPGVQSLSFSVVSRIDVTLLSGNDSLTLDSGGGNVIPAISGINYNGGTGTDTIVASQDANFTLTNASLTVSPGGVVTLSAVEQANLTGGNSPNVMDASAFSAGPVTMDGGGQNDTLIGGAGNDTLTGSEGSDLVDGRGGNDVLHGGNSGGTVLGGDGNDLLFGGNGKDFLYGQAGDDQIAGGNGDDLLDGGEGNDVLDGGNGNDTLNGGPGYDTVQESGNVNFTLTNTALNGLGTDALNGVENAALTGGSGNNTIDCSAFTGDATLSGGGGTDNLVGGSGNNHFANNVGGSTTIVGGHNTNTISLTSSGFVSLLDGGGLDTLDFSTTNAGITLDLTKSNGTGQNVDGAGFIVALTGTFENVVGTSFADNVTGNAADNQIYGGPGTDRLDGGAGNDIIYGGTGAGASDLDTSDDTIYGGPGTDRLDGGAGNDIIYGGTGPGTSDLDTSNDVIYGGPGRDLVDGGAGNDIIYGGTGPGTSDLDTGDDTLYGGLGADQIDGGAGNDVIYGGTGPGTSDLDTSNDVIYGGPGRDLVDGGAGNDIIYGGTGSPDADTSGGDDTLLGGPGNDVLCGGGGNDSLTGGPGNDTYLYVGAALGSDTITEDPNVGTDTLDFSGFAGPVSVDLAQTTPQVVNSGNLSLTLSSDTAIENVVGSRFSDTILGNGRDNQLLGADPLDDRFVNPAGWNGVTQVVYLDFDSNHSLLVSPDHVYTQPERDAIQARLGADYADFHVQFTQTVPGSGTYATLFFNKTPVVNGKPQPGGLADDLDFRNLNLGGTAAIDVNTFLGGPNEPAATSANFVAFSATVSGHELGHLMGLRHLDSAGPIGFGIPATVPPSEFSPPYPGPAQAFETNLHLMASPASVGSSLFDAVADPFFGEREAVKLAFDESGTAVNEQAGAHDSLATAQGLSLSSLAVPNTLASGYQFGKDFGFAATDVVGSIKLTNAGVSEDDYYSFAGRAGDLINLQVMSNALTRITNPIDSVLRVYDGAGNLVTYYGSTGVNDDENEGQDSVILDLILPSDGTFYVQVDTYTDGNVPDTDTGDYELFVYRFDAGNASDGGDYLDGRGGNDALVGGLGDDTLVGGTGVNTLDGGAGTDTVLETGDVNFALSDTSLTGPGTDTLAGIERAQLTGGTGANTFQILAWSGTALFDGGLGVDTLIGANTTNSWNLTGTGAGNVNGSVAFTGMEKLTGGSAGDTLNYAGFGGPVTVNLAAGTLTGFTSFGGMEGVVGSAASDTLVGPNAANSWNLTGVGSGSVGGFAFASVENLGGGTGADTLNFAAYAGPVTVNLATGSATGFSSFTGMEGVVGSAAPDTLVGPNAASSWSVTGANAGKVGGFSFSGVENLSGGSADDTYVFANGAGVSGVINAGGGTNTLDYAAYLTGVTVNLTTGAATGTGGVANVRHVFGGAGNDSLTGDAAANVLVGNGGDDTLLGNDGRDILIGGNGADYLDGGNDDDILIGARTSYDANLAALLAILQEWTRTDVDYTGRVKHISGTLGGGLNGAYYLNSATVFDDNSAPDTLWGRGGLDWFLSGKKDNVMDKAPGEINTKF
jgi:Ca2+-binding RTX toxin-like protein